MVINEPVLRAFTGASADLLQSAMNELRREDAAAAQGVANLLRAGGLVSLITTIAPSTGMVAVRVDVVDMAGKGHQLMACELRPELQA